MSRSIVPVDCALATLSHTNLATETSGMSDSTSNLLRSSARTTYPGTYESEGA
jgi:hypothetical protein